MHHSASSMVELMRSRPVKVCQPSMLFKVASNIPTANESNYLNVMHFGRRIIHKMKYQLVKQEVLNISGSLDVQR